ncbi:fibrinogen C domain-containing protein 1-like isoform X2 [Anticarsia gemmatalis]|uniref:fibrinogen C domain-containing protein 1-like isoform X2 n=1 Tax=Anticarsia gemmatalis TaxID=129554 RepID=UPI003F759F13
MWWLNFFVTLVFLALVDARREMSRDRSNEEEEDTQVHEKKKVLDYRPPTTTITSPVGEAVVEKFVETLISSERYLKMIETVERKLNHLDTTVHERTNSILKYLSEMLRVLKTSSPDIIENSLKTVKSDLEKLHASLARSSAPTMRVDASEYHVDPTLDTRLSLLETHIKNIHTGVESIVTTMSEVKNRQYRPASGTPNIRADVGSTVDALALIAEFRKTIRDQKVKKCDCRTNRVDRSERYPSDCHEIQMQGFNVSGIYKIRPDDMDPFYVLCDLTTAGGGWTVFQNRFDGSQEFYKGWNDYEYGFGNLAGEFWLGLEKLNFLTNQKLYELRIEMETQHGQDAYAGYSVFTVGPEHEGYRISTLGTFYGTAGDSLSYHAGQKFSTFDMDNDEWRDGACATEHGGAWWYKECDKSNLNGKYTQAGDDNRGQTIYWISFKGPNTPLSKTKMMIRPLPASKPIDYNDATRKLLESPKLRSRPDKVVPTPDKMSSLRGTVKGYEGPNQYRYNEKIHTADTFFTNYT